MSIRSKLNDTVGAWFREVFINRSKHISKAPPEVRNRARAMMRGGVAGVSGTHARTKQGEEEDGNR